MDTTTENVMQQEKELKRKFPDKTAWLKARREGIGGSDAPVVAGVDPWKSRLELYAEKLGLGVGDSGSEAAEWGLRLETAIAQAYQEETGREVTDEGQFTITYHPEHRFMRATLDRLVKDPKRGPGILQIKTTGAHYNKNWENDPPINFQVQLQHEIETAQVDWGSLAVLIGGQRFLHADMDRNDRFIEGLIEKEAEFWERVERMDPPEGNGSESTARALYALHPKDSGKTATLSLDLMGAAEQWEYAKEQIKQMEGLKQQAENSIKAAMGDASYGLLPNGVRFSWKHQERKGYVKEVSPCCFRQFRRLAK